MFGEDRGNNLIMALNNTMQFANNGTVSVISNGRAIQTYDDVAEIACNGANLELIGDNGGRLFKLKLNRSSIINGLRAEDFGFTDRPGLFD